MPRTKQEQIVASVKPKSNIERLISHARNKDKDFTKIRTSDGKRGYDSNMVAYINEQLDSIPAKRRAPIIAYFIEESGANPEALGDNNNAQGLGQWYPDRFDINAPGAKNVDYQLRYAVGTLSGNPDGLHWHHGGQGSGYNTARDAQRAFYNPNSDIEVINHALNRGYVRPKGKDKSVQNRLYVAEQIYDIIKEACGGKLWKKK